jgi:Tol biopolymer transport system component
MSGFANAALARLDLRALLWLTSVIVALSVPVVGHTAPGDTEVLSVGNDSNPVAVHAFCSPAGPHQCISADGRYAVFQTEASLLAGDTNNSSDIYVRDRLLQQTRLVSVPLDGAAGTYANASSSPAISADGRYVAFESSAPNLVANDTNGVYDVFVRDIINGVTERVSLTAAGTEATGSTAGLRPSISADGRFVVFDSQVPLVPGDSVGSVDVYIRDRIGGTTKRVSVRSDGVAPSDACMFASLSDDGRFVAFTSAASNLVEGDTNGLSDVFVRDMQTGAIERVSVGSGSGGDWGYEGVISADGRFVALLTTAALVPDDTNGRYDVYVRDRLLKTTQRASLGVDGRQANQTNSFDPAISADGRFVAFSSDASSLVKGDTNRARDVFVRNLVLGTTERVSIATSGLEGNNGSVAPSISRDGTFVAFFSAATNFGNPTAGAFFLHEPGGPQIKAYSLEPSSLAFGNQTITTARTIGVAVLNTGTVPIWVSSAGLSGPAKTSFALSNVCHGWVQPTLRCRTGVTFKPATVGSKIASVVVGAGGIVQSAPLSGTGVLASYTASPSTLTFGNVALGTVSTAQKVVITNRGLDALPIKSIALGGVDATQFRRSSDCPSNVPAGGSCTARVRFSPTTMGARTATLTIKAGGGGGQRIIQLTGTGL